MPVAVTQKAGLFPESFWAPLQKETNFLPFPAVEQNVLPRLLANMKYTQCFSLKTTREGTYFDRGDWG
jgi:hypothetical protein